MLSFTFIIPHYNLPSHYLRRMLDSIPHREDIQIIVVDDHSPYLYDENDKMIESKMANFPGLGEQCTEIVFLERNVGPGNARNEALKLAKGEWITFADSDDYYITENLNIFLETLKTKNQYDVVYVGFDWLNLDGSHTIDLNGYKIAEGINEIQNIEQHFLDNHQSPRKFVKRKLIEENNILFSNTIYCEDIAFSVYTLLYAQKVGTHNKPLYCYVRRKDSTTNKLSLATLLPAFANLLRINNVIKNKGVSLSVLGYILFKISKISKIIYLISIIQELIICGYITTKKDYLQSCVLRNVRPNIFFQLTDPIRVFIGGVIRK